MWKKPLWKWIKTLGVGSRLMRRRVGSKGWARSPMLSNACTTQGMWKVEQEFNDQGYGAQAIEVVANRKCNNGDYSHQSSFGVALWGSLDAKYKLDHSH
jgi:hypothetical protein